MRLLFIGDIVGQPGVRMVRTAVPHLRTSRGLDCVIANAENASGGSGCTPGAYRQIREAGVDLVTFGDHIYKKFDIAKILTLDERCCKPANYVAQAPGRDYALATLAGGTTVAAVSLLGRTFMRPVDCPFAVIDRVLARLVGVADVIVVDVHAEATADKYLLAHYLKGRVAAAIGTHTHVPTADEQILPGGTAFLCDAGMTGPYDSVLGRRVECVLSTAVTFVPTPFEVADGDVRLGGCIVDIDAATGRATAIERIAVREGDLPLTPPH